MRLRVLMLLLLFGFCVHVHAQTLTVLHVFTGGADGGFPVAGPTLDADGNVYGTNWGYPAMNGVVYKINKSNGTFSVLFRFDGSDGALPETPLLIGRNGVLYGNTGSGGPLGYGVVFSLQPPSTICRSVSCPWTEKILYNFPTGGPSGFGGGQNNMALDAAGNIWGTNPYGGQYGQYRGDGTLFEMTPNGDGTFTYTDVYDFGSGVGGAGAIGPGSLTLDSAGNIYVPAGTNYPGCVTIAKLSNVSGTWTETDLSTGCDGGFSNENNPTLALDPLGNIFGTCYECGYFENSSVVWELTTPPGPPPVALYTFSGEYGGPQIGPTLDSAGNVYGTTSDPSPNGPGSAWKLAAGTYAYTNLYIFTANGEAGFQPDGQVVIDSSGNLYGTNSEGGQNGEGSGTVWKLTP